MVQKNKNIFFSDSKFGLVYITLDSCLDKTFLDIEDFKLEYNISAKNLKHVEDKLFFHHFFYNILEIVREIKFKPGNKPVLYISASKILQKEFKSQKIIRELKVLKKLLPIPLIIPLDEEVVFEGTTGKLKEYNNKCMEFYFNRRIQVKEIKKYLHDKGYNTLLNSLSSTIDLKGLYY